MKTTLVVGRRRVISSATCRPVMPGMTTSLSRRSMTPG
jgi:hypothetical protein